MRWPKFWHGRHSQKDVPVSFSWSSRLLNAASYIFRQSLCAHSWHIRHFTDSCDLVQFSPQQRQGYAGGRPVFLLGWPAASPPCWLLGWLCCKSIMTSTTRPFLRKGGGPRSTTWLAPLLKNITSGSKLITVVFSLFLITFQFLIKMRRKRPLTRGNGGAAGTLVPVA
jgi:hypothetical protein